MYLAKSQNVVLSLTPLKFSNHFGETEEKHSIFTYS